MGKIRVGLGLMSGTSMDGIDAALLYSDGGNMISRGPASSLSYDHQTKVELKNALGARHDMPDLVESITRKHALIVNKLLQENNITNNIIDVIGFHGHTLLHDPKLRYTRQIGDGCLLAKLTGIDVVDDFRSADLAAGGEGAPLAPLYHKALGIDLPKPLAILNIGGVANVTWIGREENLIAFDTGPGNALIDDWVKECMGGEMDISGQLASSGSVDMIGLSKLLENDYFKLSPPKSLDRNEFKLPTMRGWSAADGAATLTAFTASAVAKGREHFPEMPSRWLVCGGGRHNLKLMSCLSEFLNTVVAPVEDVGWRGDFLEAEAFAYLAIRHLDGLPLSLPNTTGVPHPLTGGRLNKTQN